MQPLLKHNHSYGPCGHGSGAAVELRSGGGTPLDTNSASGSGRASSASRMLMSPGVIRGSGPRCVGIIPQRSSASFDDFVMGMAIPPTIESNMKGSIRTRLARSRRSPSHTIPHDPRQHRRAL
jgi:hypothetical protein